MPRMSDTMEEGNIVAWLKEEGETVESGEILAEVETDKATMELDSYFDGVLLHIAVKEGTVPINGVIAVIGEEGEDWKAAIDADGGSSNSSDDPTPDQNDDDPTDDTQAPPQEKVAGPASADTSDAGAASGNGRVKASPLARSMAKEAGLNLADLNGSGENGRIVKRDVQAALDSAPAAQPAAAPAQPAAMIAPANPAAAPASAAPAPPEPNVPAFSFNAAGENYEDTPVSQMRKVIARRLGESKFSAPHFYVTVSIDMGKVWDMRKRLNEVAPVKISFNDLIVKACAVNLRKHPSINSSWLGDKIRVNHDVNIGVAVAIPDGLLVPVVRYADMKSLSQINQEVKNLAGKAKQKKLSPDEMTGNTFTISNLGMFGVDEFTAIINPPDACIMAVSGIREVPVVKNGEVVPGRVMKVTLSSDHRVVDGASAAAFLNDVKATLEDPIRLLV